MLPKRSGDESLGGGGLEVAGNVCDTGWGLESRRFWSRWMRASSETHCIWIGEGLKGSMGSFPWLCVFVENLWSPDGEKSIHPFRAH